MDVTSSQFTNARGSGRLAWPSRCARSTNRTLTFWSDSLFPSIIRLHSSRVVLCQPPFDRIELSLVDGHRRWLLWVFVDEEKRLITFPIFDLLSADARNPPSRLRRSLVLCVLLHLSAQGHQLRQVVGHLLRFVWRTEPPLHSNLLATVFHSISSALANFT